MTVRAFLALGTNVGEREQNLLKALQHLEKTEGIRISAISAVYETDPVGYTDQPPFLNMAIAVETQLSPEQLLEAVLNVEKQLGRIRTIRWGPRTIDIDILLYGDAVVQLPHLQIPHPAVTERAFVLVPLTDLAQAGEITIHGKSIHEWLEAAGDRKGVRRWGILDWGTEFAPFAN